MTVGIARIALGAAVGATAAVAALAPSWSLNVLGQTTPLINPNTLPVIVVGVSPAQLVNGTVVNQTTAPVNVIQQGNSVTLSSVNPIYVVADPASQATCTRTVAGNNFSITCTTRGPVTLTVLRATTEAHNSDPATS